MTDYWQVTTATPDPDSAASLAKSAVESRLAAGAHILGPLTSYFWHDGQFGTGKEWHVVLKTTKDPVSGA